MMIVYILAGKGTCKVVVNMGTMDTIDTGAFCFFFNRSVFYFDIFSRVYTGIAMK